MPNSTDDEPMTLETMLAAAATLASRSVPRSPDQRYSEIISPDEMRRRMADPYWRAHLAMVQAAIDAT